MGSLKFGEMAIWPLQRPDGRGDGSRTIQATTVSPERTKMSSFAVKMARLNSGAALARSSIEMADMVQGEYCGTWNFYWCPFCRSSLASSRWRLKRVRAMNSWELR